MKAVVATELNSLEVLELDLAPPRQGEVRVRMKATGLCHSDLSMLNGTIPTAFPIALGHEGAGVVEEVGEGVCQVRPGDHVALSFIPQCGECFHCVRSEPYLCCASPNDGTLMDGTTRLRRGDQEVRSMCYLGNMAEQAVVPAACVLPIDKDIPFQAAALVGCAVSTGVGAAIKTAEVRPGDSVAVVGCGGIGLSVIQGCRLAGAGRIVAVDLSQEKMDMALGFGATERVASSDQALHEVMAMTDGIGVDWAFEAAGHPAAIDLCIKLARRGGTAVLVGVGRLQEQFSVSALILPLTGKTIRGCMYGSVNFKTDFPMYLDLYRRGLLDLDAMVTRTYALDEAPQAFADLERGLNARGVILHG